MSILFPVFVGIARKARVQEEWKRTPVSTLLDILHCGLVISALINLYKQPYYLELCVFDVTG